MAALAVLDRSEDTTGKYQRKVQPNTYRKAQSAMGNVTRASVAGQGEAVGAYGLNKIWIADGGKQRCCDLNIRKDTV